VARKSFEDVFERTFEKIANSLKDDGASYADLAGNVYDKKTYLDRLRSDPEFAETQLDAFIQPPTSEGSGITPAEQRTLARRFAKFADAHSPDVTAFLRAYPVLSETYTVGDLKRVLDTVKFEMDIEPIKPDNLDDADEALPMASFLRE
jgi:hypothetical protein